MGTKQDAQDFEQVRNFELGILRNAKVSQDPCVPEPSRNICLVVIKLDNCPRHHSRRSISMLIIHWSLTTNNLERQVWDELLSRHPKRRSNFCKNHTVSWNPSLSPRTLCLISQMMEPGMWGWGCSWRFTPEGIQKGFLKEVTPEEGLD